MKRWLILLFAALLLLNVAACAQQDIEPVAQYECGLWFAINSGSDRSGSSAVVREERGWETEPTARQLLQALLNGPYSDDLHAPFPAGVSIRSVEVSKESRTALVDFSEQYGKLSGFDLTIADYCVALTLCQLPSVENVRITVEGKALAQRNRQRLHTGDVLLSGISDEPDTFLAALYFPNKRGSLSVEYRQVSRVDSSEPVEIVLYELLRGPSAAETFGSLPAGTRVRSIEAENGVCVVDLSKEFLINAPQDPEQAGLTLYALVNSLCALGGVSQVRLLVEGEFVESYGGVSVGSQNLFATNMDLVESQIKD